MASESFNECKRLLLKLHELYVAGKSQTAEANRIRADMEIPERDLTELEQERLDGLSGDLYMLVHDEVKVKSNAPIDLREFEIMANSEDWDGVLLLLRIDNFPAANDEIASTRATCWMGLGDYDVALLFAEFAVKLNPQNKRYRVMETFCRLQLGQGAENVAVAEMCTFLEPQVMNNSIHEMSFLKTA